MKIVITIATILAATALNNALAAGTTAPAATATTAAHAVIPHTDAAKHYGDTVTIEGTVVATSCDGKKCYVNFNQDFRKAVSAIIDTADIAKFTKATDTKAQQADLDKMYKGKKVHLTGLVTEYKSTSSNTSRPQMALTGPADIKVVK